MITGEEVGGPEAALEVDRMTEVAADEETAIVVVIVTEIDHRADGAAAVVAVKGAGTEGHLVPGRVRVPAREIETGTDALAHRAIERIDTEETEGATETTETIEMAIAQDVEEGTGRVVVIVETETEKTEITATRSVRMKIRILTLRIIRTIMMMKSETMATSNLTSSSTMMTMMLVVLMAAITTGAWMIRRMRPQMTAEGKLIKSRRRMLQRQLKLLLPHRLKTSSLQPTILKIKNRKSLQQRNKSKQNLKRLPKQRLLPRKKRLKSLKKLQPSSSSKSERRSQKLQQHDFLMSISICLRQDLGIINQFKSKKIPYP